MGSIPASQYPLVNPRDLPGRPPYEIAIGFHDDWVTMKIGDGPNLSACEMTVGLALGPGITWQKEIWEWHANRGPGFFVSNWVAGAPAAFMNIERDDPKADSSTLLFKKAGALGVMTGMYALDLNTFWPFLGGKMITFTWISDSRGNGGGSGLWGNESVAPPELMFIDGGALSAASVGESSLIKGSGPAVFFAFGGAAIHIPSTTIFDDMGYDWGKVQSVADPDLNHMTELAADGTVFFEANPFKVYFMVGGAKLLTQGNEAVRLVDQVSEGLTNAGMVWSGALGSVPGVPRDGTLLRERSTAPVYVMRTGQKRHISNPAVFDQLCFSWGNVRIVPDGSLAGIPTGGPV